MKLVFFSPTGTTKKILHAIAKGYGASSVEVVDLTLPGAAAFMQAWQGYLDQTAPFVKNIADIDVPAIF
ncbi:MAG: hypothetical protein QNK40_01445 [Desulfobacterales bacterium]|nr:hypothetical protein [Desulfobacterales bacterium]